MNSRAAVANALWAASNLPAWVAFRRALNRPRPTQQSLLHDILHRSADTSFGREHKFDRIKSYADYAARVPTRDYAEMEPWIDHIRQGQEHVLTADKVRRLATTGGTNGPRKLIPYTARLQTEFNRAIGPWVVDLFRARPSLMLGCAYWSISPVVQSVNTDDSSAVPIGFEEDTEYLGGIRRRLVDAVMAVPSSIRHAPTLQEWKDQTIRALVARTDLRLISVWHPSFLSSLLNALPGSPAGVWPNLKLVSCWGDAHSTLPVHALQKRLPGVEIQPKGLIATEGIVSIPFAGRWPLAIRSHFFEFARSDGATFLADELTDGESYEVVLTTGAGLYRYRLNDRVIVEGFVGRTPSVRFVGKTENISDRFGEKLSEAFVGTVLRRLMRQNATDWTFAMLAPEESRYTLFVEGKVPETLATELDAQLKENPHYAYCRQLGQLLEPRVFAVGPRAWDVYAARLVQSGRRLGDIKPVALSPLSGWRRYFERASSECD